MGQRSHFCIYLSPKQGSPQQGSPQVCVLAEKYFKSLTYPSHKTKWNQVFFSAETLSHVWITSWSCPLGLTMKTVTKMWESSEERHLYPEGTNQTCYWIQVNFLDLQEASRSSGWGWLCRFWDVMENILEMVSGSHHTFSASSSSCHSGCTTLCTTALVHWEMSSRPVYTRLSPRLKQRKIMYSQAIAAI